MNKRNILLASAASLIGLMMAGTVEARIAGIGRVAGDSSCGSSGCTFNLTARSGQVTLGDGNSVVAWGYSPITAPAATDPAMQYPGPTLIVNQGDTVTVTLRNTLPVPVSVVFPGQQGVTASGGVAGALTQEVPAGAPGSTVTYSFVATQPGTYLYQSGTRPELEVEMGLVGTLIVRPWGVSAGEKHAYVPASTTYDREYLYLLTEMDRVAHEQVDAIQRALAAQGPGGTATFDTPPAPLQAVDPATFHATLWFINGRNGPDTLLNENVAWLPNQPYNATTRAEPGERVLMRIVGAGRDLHPFHHHGNNAWLIARDGRLLQSDDGSDAPYPDFQTIPELAARQARLPDQALSNFTIQIVPGSTYDAIFTWTGYGLGWDIYGHADNDSNPSNVCTVALEPAEDPGSHCKAIPVTLPEQQSLAFGGFWSGSPYLGSAQSIPPLQGGLNPSNGLTFMWHSHTERELTNDDIFPGGMMTMLIIDPPGTLAAE